MLKVSLIGNLANDRARRFRQYVDPISLATPS